MLRLVPALLALTGCAADSTGVPPPCVLASPVPDQSAGVPGDAIRFATSPLSEAFDTSVLVGSVRAEVLGVTRDECEDCDSCREAEACSPCEDCDACAADCGPCDESVRVTLPEIGPGTWTVSVTNRYGQSDPGLILVETADTGATP